MAKATFIKRIGENMRGDARLYELETPVYYSFYDLTTGESGEAYTKHVLVSAADVPFSGPETYIFPADETGKVLDWGELDGSFRGSLDHARALANAGYEEVEP